MEHANFLVGLAALGLLGFATQRGGACAVASIVELVEERRPGRLLALVEASVLVAIGLVILNAAGLRPAIAHGYAATATTVVGGVVLGIGAFCNRSCAIGTIARIGSGQLAYLATPLGFLLGCLAMSRVAAPERLAGESVLLAASGWLAILGLVLVAVRLVTHGWHVWRTGSGPLRYIWSPHVATTLSGVAFLAALLTVGDWTYTATLDQFARGGPIDLMRDCLLFVALMAGAVWGGWTVGLRPTRPTVARVVRCLAGGALMGIGAALIPGGSDGLVFAGMPLLWPHAWLAFASMCVTIYAAVRIAKSTLAGGNAVR